MTVLHHDTKNPALLGRDGELFLISVSVDPRSLEELLEALATLGFPLNPQLYHQTGWVAVEFPAYANQLEEIRAAVERHGFDGRAVTHERVLARTQTA